MKISERHPSRNYPAILTGCYFCGRRLVEYRGEKSQNGTISGVEWLRAGVIVLVCEAEGLIGFSCLQCVEDVSDHCAEQEVPE